MARLLPLLVATTLAVHAAFGKSTASSEEAFDDCLSVFAAQSSPDRLADREAVQVCHDGYYATLFNPSLKSPYYAAYRADFPGKGKSRITRQATAWKYDSALDSDVQNPPKDKGWSQGYDRGHLAPSNAMSLTTAMQKTTFVMSNAMPQAAPFNRGAWQQREKQIVTRVDNTKKSLFVVTGVFYEDESKVQTIGDAEMSIPDFYYSAVCDPVKGESLAYKGRNAAGPDGKVAAETKKEMATLITVAALEKFVGFELLPDDCNKNKVASWPEFGAKGGAADDDDSFSDDASRKKKPAAAVADDDEDGADADGNFPTEAIPKDGDLAKCSDSFAGGFVPQTKSGTSVKLCRNGYYATEYDTHTKAPLWSAYKYRKGTRITRGSSKFYYDPEVPKSQQNDPRNKGWGETWNRGHVAPSNALSLDNNMQKSTFVVTNVAPQFGLFNQQSWQYREQQIGYWVQNNNKELFVVTGTFFNSANKFRLTNDMPIPDYYFSVVCDLQGKASVGWYGENSEAAGAFPPSMLELRSAAEIEKKFNVKLLPAACNPDGRVNADKWKEFQTLSKNRK